MLNKTVVVTGASSGIGAATAKKFAAKGYNVILSGRSEEHLNQVAVDFTSSANWVADLNSSSSCNELIEFALATFGSIDVLVNCAGIIYRADIENTSDEMWRQTMNINLDIPFYLSRSALPHLQKSQGVIINIASDWGLQGGTRASAYCASK